MMFKVPEDSRLHDGPMGSDLESCGLNGAFLVTSPEPGWHLLIIACDGEIEDAHGWEHVSTHAVNIAGKKRTPTWKEMCHVKDLFWDPEDVVVQFHPRKSKYINQHPNVLHMWRHRLMSFPEPPPELVGIEV
jgi:hypothetical protein